MARKLWIVGATVFMLAGVLSAPAAHGDVVLLKDGRAFTGVVVSEQPDFVQIDTVVSTIRATLQFKTDEVTKIVKKPVPAGFFDAPKIERKSKASEFGATDNLYLEVPIKGLFGKDVSAKGIQEVLAYASDYRIGNIVFVLDSEGVSGAEDVSEIANLLRKYSEQINYHVVIRKAVGDALIFVLLCHSIHMMDGAQVGGGDFTPRNNGSLSPEDRKTILAAKAARVMEFVGTSRRSELIRPMIDPTVTVYAWKDKSGRIEAAETLPEDVPAADCFISKTAKDKVLVLNYEQLTKMGLPLLTGDMDALGKSLGFESWRKESDFGTEAMTTTAQGSQDPQQKDQLAFENRVKRNIQERGDLEAAAKEYLRQAQEWDPNKGQYSLRTAQWQSWGQNHYGHGGNYRSGGGSSGTVTTWTPESRQEWRDRSDAAANALSKAIQAINTYKQLEAQARQLGLSTTYGQKTLEAKVSELTMARKNILKNRNRSGP